MKGSEASRYHWLFGERHARTVYYRKDFIDYALMCVVTAMLLLVSYGPSHPLALAGCAMSLIMLASFAYRHGAALTMPLILRRPQELVYSVVYKLRNIRAYWVIGLVVLAAENLFVYLTPELSHRTDLMRTLAMWAFYLHFFGITLYRTIILVAHLRKTELVREVLMQTSWRKSINEKTNMTWEVFHAYFTGVLSHLLMISPIYIVIQYSNFSVWAIPVVIVLNIVNHYVWLKNFNDWSYRNHWLGHNSDFEFIYLHGPHHDAIPSGLLGVSECANLEGYVRHVVGSSLPFYCPFFSLLVFTVDVKSDIDMHQYIPGIFPKMSIDDLSVIHHATHHYGRLEPYGFGVKFDMPNVSDEYKKKYRYIPDEVKNSLLLDETLTGYRWDNPTYQRILELYGKYHH